MGIDPNKIISPLMSPENLHGLSSLRNFHKSESLFVIGNGSSLTAEDLEAIAETGQPSIAFNDIFSWYGSTSFRPTYYIVEDPIFARKHLDQILAMRDIVKLFPEQLMGVFPPSRNILYYGLNEEISPSSSTYFSETPQLRLRSDSHIPRTSARYLYGGPQNLPRRCRFRIARIGSLPREIRAMVAQNGEDTQAYNTCLNDVHWIEAHQQYAIKAFRTAQRFAAYRGISIGNAFRRDSLSLPPRAHRSASRLQSFSSFAEKHPSLNLHNALPLICRDGGLFWIPAIHLLENTSPMESKKVLLVEDVDAMSSQHLQKDAAGADTRYTPQPVADLMRSK